MRKTLHRILRIAFANLLFALAGLTSQAFAQMPGYDSQFVSYSFPGGKQMDYDSTYFVTITMRNTGDQEWRPGDVNLLQDDGDVNWRASDTFNTVSVFPGQTYDFNFYVNPKPCLFGGIFGCYATKFYWQLSVWRIPMVPGRVRFGAVTPNAGVSVDYYVAPPAPSQVTSTYKGMVSIVPPGTTPPPPPPMSNWPDKIYP